MKTIEYKGYSIEPDYVGYKFWKTSEGIDCSNDGDGWKSNVSHSKSVEDAKADIDDLIYETSEPETI